MWRDHPKSFTLASVGDSGHQDGERWQIARKVSFMRCKSGVSAKVVARQIVLGIAVTAGVLTPIAPALCGDRKMNDTEQQKIVTTTSGLRYQDTVVGTGAKAEAGKRVIVHYTGWLDDNGAHGKKFDSSKDRNEPFDFALGAGQVIAGWDEGVAGMLVGGKRTLMIPSNLGYGARGAGGVIPPHAGLIFDVELLGVK